MDPELVVDAVDHDVYLWDVKFMGGFIPGSDLAEDLDTLDAVNGYRYIQIRLHFMADLYPFYPPRVTLVRPKLGGMVPGAMAAHPRLHLRNWQPFRPIKSVIEHLKAFLQKFARVDLASELNEIERFPEGAYVDDVSRLETSLARLAACGTSCGGPLIPSRYVDMYAAETAMEKESGATGGYEAEFEGGDVDDVVDFAKVLNEDAGGGGAVGGAVGGSAVDDKGNKGDKGKMTGSLKTKAAGDPSTNKGKGHKPEYWAKGTGYGHDVKGDGADGGAQTWDAAAAKGAQAAEDQSVLTLLVEATRFIRALPLAALAPGKSRTQVLSKSSGNLLESLGMSDGDVPVLSDAEAARAAECVRASCLPKFLARELKNCSFMNMTNRGPFYSSLMRAAAGDDVQPRRPRAALPRYRVPHGRGDQAAAPQRVHRARREQPEERVLDDAADAGEVIRDEELPRARHLPRRARLHRAVRARAQGDVLRASRGDPRARRRARREDVDPVHQRLGGDDAAGRASDAQQGRHERHRVLHLQGIRDIRSPGAPGGHHRDVPHGRGGGDLHRGRQVQVLERQARADRGTVRHEEHERVEPVHAVHGAVRGGQRHGVQ